MQCACLLAQQSFGEGGVGNVRGQVGASFGNAPHEGFLTGKLILADGVVDAVLGDHVLRECGIDDPPHQHVFDKGIFFAQVALDEIIDPTQAQVVGRSSEKDDRARRRVGAEIACEFQQRRDAGSLLGTRGEGRHDRHGVVVRLQHDHVFF